MILEFELEDTFVTVDDNLTGLQVGDLVIDGKLDMFEADEILVNNHADFPVEVYKIINIKQK